MNPYLLLNDALVPTGSSVSVPDAGIASLIGAQLAAEFVCTHHQDPTRLMMLQTLVPASAADPTAVDSVPCPTFS